MTWGSSHRNTALEYNTWCRNYVPQQNTLHTNNPLEYKSFLWSYNTFDGIMYWVTTSYGNTISRAGIMCWITSCCINAQVYDTFQNIVLEYNMLLWNIGKLLLELSKIVIPCIGMMHGGTTPCIGVVHWSMTTCIGVMHWSTTPCIIAQHLALE